MNEVTEDSKEIGIFSLIRTLF